MSFFLDSAMSQTQISAFSDSADADNADAASALSPHSWYL